MYRNENENVIRFQSYDYEKKTYYLPRITDALKVVDVIKKNIKTEDDLNVDICDKCKSCIDKYSCKKINCNDCLLRLKFSEKYKALKEFFEIYGFNLLPIEKSNLPFDNETINKSIDCLKSIIIEVGKSFGASYDLFGARIDNNHSNYSEDSPDIMNIRKNMPYLKKIAQYLCNYN